MGRIEDLAAVYERHIAAPWTKTLAGAQRVLMLVYDKELERTFRARIDDFKHRTEQARHGWVELDCTKIFAEWMAADEYRDAYFEAPDDLGMKVEAEFKAEVAGRLRKRLQDSDENTVVAFLGVACLYGFVHVSEVVREVETEIKGRLVVFFPGTKDGNNYRLLDARDGWNYLANGITLQATEGAP